jgi:outer membrane protein assembly factor BamD (BamD/ComL family)
MTSTAPAKSAAAVAGATSVPGSPAAAWVANPQNRVFLAAGVVALVGLVAWFVVLSGQRKEQFAGRALDQAREVAESGNLPLAASDLQKVISTYGGTRAAQEAIIALNQVRLVNGQHELAAVGLQDFLKSNPAAEFRGPAYGLLGRALENAKRPGEAADAFMSASRESEVDYLRAEFLLEAGRAYASAGDRAKAIVAYQRIVKEFPKAASKTEAAVRLAELQSAPVK